MTDKPSAELSRRDALKLLGAAAGATLLANLPSRWSTPQLVAGVLPAHAQTSLVFCEALGLAVTVFWDAEVDLDGMLLVPVPGQFLVTPKAFPAPIPQGTVEPITGAAHGGDDTGGEGSSETITVPLGSLFDGVWVVALINPSDASVPVRVVASGACSVDIEFDVPPGGWVLPVLVENCEALCPQVSSLSALAL